MSNIHTLLSADEVHMHTVILNAPMAIKKTKLHSSLWPSCNELRGGMDASLYNDYVLTLLFMKNVSDKYKGDP